MGYGIQRDHPDNLRILLQRIHGQTYMDTLRRFPAGRCDVTSPGNVDVDPNYEVSKSGFPGTLQQRQ